MVLYSDGAIGRTARCCERPLNPQPPHANPSDGVVSPTTSPKPTLTWKSPVESIIRYDTAVDENNNNGKHQRKVSNASKVKQRGHGIRSRSKSGSESRVPHRRSSTVTKRKYPNNQCPHPMQSWSHCTNSPNTASKYRMLGKAWIRPVPVRYGAEEKPIQHKTYSTLDALAKEQSSSRRLSDDSPSVDCPHTVSPPPVDCVNGANDVFSRYYASPNSSFDTQHTQHMQHRLPEKYDVDQLFFEPIPSPVTPSKPPMAFGESGKPITSLPHRNLGKDLDASTTRGNYLPTCHKFITRARVLSPSPTTVATNTLHHGHR